MTLLSRAVKLRRKQRTAAYEKTKTQLQEEHKKALGSLKDAEEIKAEKYTYKNKLYDAQMAHESRLQEIKDRKHDAFMHKFHLIDLLRMSKYTFAQKQAQKIENYKYTFNMTQFLYKNGLYIVIILIFIASVYHYTNCEKYTALYSNEYPEYLTAGFTANVPRTWCCRPDPLNRYRPFCRTYGWYGYGYSNHYYA